MLLVLLPSKQRLWCAVMCFDLVNNPFFLSYLASRAPQATFKSNASDGPAAEYIDLVVDTVQGAAA